MKAINALRDYLVSNNFIVPFNALTKKQLLNTKC